MDDLFGYKKQRKKRQILAQMIDVGQDDVEFECKKCGWSSWISGAEDWTNTKILYGIPCPECNKKEGIKKI